MNDNRNIFFTIGISFWQTFFIFLLVLFFVIFMIYFWKKTKSFSKIIFIAFIGAAFISIVICFFDYFYSDLSYQITISENQVINWSWQNEVYTLLNIFTSIYLNLIFISLPFFIFFVTTTLIINNKNTSSSFFSKSFLSLIIPVLIGMTVALFFIPLIKNINLIENVTNQEDIFSILEENNLLSIPMLIINTFNFAGDNVISFIPVIVLMIFSILVGFSIKFFLSKNQKNNEDYIEGENKKATIVEHFEWSKDIVFYYLRLVSYFLPFVILTKLPTIFLNPSQFKDLLLFLGVFLLGLILTIIIFNVISLFLLKTKEQKNKYYKNYFKYIGIAFIKSNSINYLPETISFSKEIGIDDSISEFTSTLALNVGPAICSGYYLMLIALIGLGQVDALNIINISFIFLLVIIINLTTSGTAGGDQIARNIVISTLSVSFGIPVDFYYGTIFSIEGILEPIRHIGNSTSYLTSNIIHQRIN